MSKSNDTELQTIRMLVKDYFELPYGFHIEQHTRLHKILMIESLQYPNHPCTGLAVYISRKSIKHFVESRKTELSKNHNTENSLRMIYFAIDSVADVIGNFDTFNQKTSDKISFTKRYDYLKSYSIRVILEFKDSHLEIVSIHFTKIKKPSQG